MPEQEPAKADERRHPFIEHLERLAARDNEGRYAALAALRRGLGKPPGSVVEMHRFVAPLLRTCRSRPEEDGLYLIAALFARWHQGKDEPESAGSRKHEKTLGWSLREAARNESGAVLPENLERLDKRLTALLKCRREDLSEHLRRAITFLRSKDVPVNWDALLHGIRHWDHEERFIQRKWAAEFWKSEEEGGKLPPQEQDAVVAESA